MVTVVKNTIGAGGDYATLALWEAATDNNLVSADEQHDGQLLGLSDLGATDLNVIGAVTDATRFRRLTFATGKRYDPIADTGAGITSSDATRTLRWGERYFQLVGVLARNTGTGRCLNSTPAGDDFLIDAGFMDKTGASGYGIHTNHGSSGSIVRNSIAISPNNTDVGINSVAQSLIVDNNVVYGFGNGYAILDTLLTKIRNSIGIHISGGEAFDSSQTYTSGEFSHNLSTDATAPGGGTSYTNETASDVLRDHDNGDFRLVSTHNNANGNGVDLSTSFTTSIDGSDRGSTSWDMGAYKHVPVTTFPVGIATVAHRARIRLQRM